MQYYIQIGDDSVALHEARINEMKNKIVIPYVKVIFDEKQSHKEWTIFGTICKCDILWAFYLMILYSLDIFFIRP